MNDTAHPAIEPAPYGVVLASRRHRHRFWSQRGRLRSRELQLDRDGFKPSGLLRVQARAKAPQATLARESLEIAAGLAVLNVVLLVVGVF